MRRIVAVVVLIGLALAPALSFAATYPSVGNNQAGPLVTMHSAATTGNGTFFDFGGKVRYVTIYIQWHASCTGGAVIVETADNGGYSGTWAALTSAITYTAGKQDVVQIIAPARAIRVRISSNVTGTGASVSVYAQGSNT